MTPPRTQTRAFLFAGLRGYPAYAECRGDDAARELLRRYRRLVRDEIARHGGAEIRTEGDCAEESRVHGTCQSGLHAGQVMCYVADGNAVIAWTFDHANIYAVARRRGAAETSALYEWWSTTGVQLGN